MGSIFVKLGIDPTQKEAFEQPCVIRDILDRVGDRWSLLILAILGEGTHRFNELARKIGDISKQMLSRTLQRLEQDGLVQRTVFPDTPPRVEYRLTAMGESFLTPLESLLKWADDHHKAIVTARFAYGDRHSAAD